MQLKHKLHIPIFNIFQYSSICALSVLAFLGTKPHLCCFESVFSFYIYFSYERGGASDQVMEYLSRLARIMCLLHMLGTATLAIKKDPLLFRKSFVLKVNCGRTNWLLFAFSSMIKRRLHHCRFSQLKETFHRRIVNNIFTHLSSLFCKKIIIIFISRIFQSRKSMILMKRAEMVLMRVEWRSTWWKTIDQRGQTKCLWK